MKPILKDILSAAVAACLYAALLAQAVLAYQPA